MVWLNAIKLFFLSKGKLIGYGIVVLFLLYVGYKYYSQAKTIQKQQIQIKSLNASNSNLEEKLENIKTTNKENIKEFEDYKKQTQNTFTLLEKAHEKEIKRVKFYTRLKKDIQNVQKNEDDIVAPVLLHTLSSLQELQTRTYNHNKGKKDKTKSP